MANKPKSLLEGGPANALSEGAARLERLIESVKSQQAEPAKPAPAPNPLLQESPGEAWSRNFQSHCIGPDTAGFALTELAPVPRAMIVPSAPDIVPGRSGGIAERPAPGNLGSRIGKSEGQDKRRRSWLGRMFARS